MSPHILDIRNRAIFISPIDWGMGHATRCVPIIEALSQNNQVFLGVTESNIGFFEFYFPELQKIHLPSYGIRYSYTLPLFLKLIWQIPRILKVIKKEGQILEASIAQHQINLVISDNRFGCYSKKTESILISHQLNLQVPFFRKFANTIYQKFIQHFPKIWVPDFIESDKRLSGALSESRLVKVPVTFIGPLSALQKFAIPNQTHNIDVLLLLSGPEPQRSVLEEKLLRNPSLRNRKTVLVRGSEKPFNNISINIDIYGLVYGENLAKLIARANTVVCRSGYSTLMDLFILNKSNLVLIPTPGQSEQVYLAKHWSQKFNSKVCLQNEAEEFNF